jgi:hypothetical protein
MVSLPSFQADQPKSWQQKNKINPEKKYFTKKLL